MENAPPLHTRIGALCSVPVCPLPEDDVGLLVLDLGYEFRQGSHCYEPLAIRLQKGCSGALCAAPGSGATIRTWHTVRLSRDAELTLFVQGILRRLALRDIDNAVYIEGHLFAIRIPVFIAKAVTVFSGDLADKRMVAGRHARLVDEILLIRVLNLQNWKSECQYISDDTG